MHFFSSSRSANSRHFTEDSHLTDPKRFFCARYLLCRARNYGNAAMIRTLLAKLMKAQTFSNCGRTLGESAHEFGEDHVEAEALSCVPDVTSSGATFVQGLRVTLANQERRHEQTNRLINGERGAVSGE